MPDSTPAELEQVVRRVVSRLLDDDAPPPAAKRSSGSGSRRAGSATLAHPKRRDPLQASGPPRAVRDPRRGRRRRPRGAAGAGARGDRGAPAARSRPCARPACGTPRSCARHAHEETGLGRVRDKVGKNEFAARASLGVEDLETRAFAGEHGLDARGLGAVGRGRLGDADQLAVGVHRQPRDHDDRGRQRGRLQRAPELPLDVDAHGRAAERGDRRGGRAGQPVRRRRRPDPGVGAGAGDARRASTCWSSRAARR